MRVFALVFALSALPAFAQSAQVKKYLNTAITLYENLEYEKALKQLKSAKAKSAGPDDDAKIALLDECVVSENGPLGFIQRGDIDLVEFTSHVPKPDDTPLFRIDRVIFLDNLSASGCRRKSHQRRSCESITRIYPALKNIARIRLHGDDGDIATETGIPN